MAAALYFILPTIQSNPNKVVTTDFSIPEDYTIIQENDTSLIIQQNNNTTSYYIWKLNQSVNDSVKKYKARYKNYTIKADDYTLNDKNIGTILAVTNNETNKSRYDYYIESDGETCYHITEKGKHNTTALDSILSSFTK